MNEQDFFLVFGLSSVITILLCIPPKRTWGYAFSVAVLLLIIVGVVSGLSALAQNRNPVVQLITLNSLSDRTALATHVAALCFGILAGVSLVTLFKRKAIVACVIVSTTYLLAGASTFAIVAKNALSPYLSDPNASTYTGMVSSETRKGWKITDSFDLPLSPTSMCVTPDGSTLYVAGYAGNYMQNGSVARVVLNGESREVSVVASGLTRPHGIAYRNGSIYVSRAGQYAKANSGVFEQVATGAVTRLSDFDGDGYFEHYHDIVTGLPGPQLPDGLHQNNGIAFADDGTLYVTIGNLSNQAPPRLEFEGTILRTNENGDSPEVFADGFRNPFGICVDDQGRVFCTDNDPNVTNLGDKLNLVQQGKHYGHPYDAIPDADVRGSIKPILRLSSAQGIASIPPAVRTIAGGDLLVASYGDDAVNIVSIADSNDIESKVTFLAKVPSVVAVACTPDAEIYACSYGDRKVVKITVDR